MVGLVAVLELMVICALALFGLTQVLFPLANGKPLFPFFRRPDRAARMLAEAQQRRAAAEQMLEAAKLEAEAARLHEEALQTRVRQFEETGDRQPAAPKERDRN